MQRPYHSIVSLSLCALVLGAAGARADQSEIAHQSASIEEPGSAGKFDFLRVDTKRHRLLAAHENDGTMDVFDLDKNSLITRIKLGGAVDTAMDPESKRYYVSVQEDKRVAVLDAATLREVKSIKLDGPSDAIIFEPKNRKVYVTHDDGDHVWVIDPGTDRVVGAISIPGAPEFMVYDPDADRIYLNIKPKDEIVVIDPGSDTVVAHWPTAPATQPHGLALDSKNHRVFSSGANGKLAVIDTRTGQVSTVADIANKVDQIAFDPASGLVYCAGPDKMSVVQAGADKVSLIGNIATAATAKNVAVDPATRSVWTTYTDGKSSFAKAWIPKK